jgi:hypothetical protein
VPAYRVGIKLRSTHCHGWHHAARQGGSSGVSDLVNTHKDSHQSGDSQSAVDSSTGDIRRPLHLASLHGLVC